MGMTPAEAIDQVAREVDPSKFGGERMGSLPPASMPPASMPPQQPPMSGDQMSQYLMNKVAEIKGRTGGGRQLGALPQQPTMNMQPQPMSMQQQPMNMQGMRK